MSVVLEREAEAPSEAASPPGGGGPRRRIGWPRGRGRRPAARRAAPRPRTARPPQPSEEAGALLSSALTMLALVCLWAAVQMLLLGGLSQQRAQDLLHAEFRTQLAGATAPVGPVVPPGDPVAFVTIPTIGLEQVVVEGTASGDLLAGPGHRRDTVLPGQAGASVVYGRAATYGGPFARLGELRPGDVVTVVMAQGELDLTVEGVRRAGDPLPQPLDQGAARLTLVTAGGEGRFAALRPNETLYVDAVADEGFPAPAGRAIAVPESEQAMAADTTALPLLVLCLALLVALTLGVVAARQRHPAALVWVVACPLALALSWATTDVVMRLLPNLL